MKNILLFTFILLSLSTRAQIITTVAGTDTNYYNGDNIPAITAGLDAPYDVALDGKGNLYITDGGHNRIRKVDTAGIITTIAGNGGGGYNGDGIPATTAQIFHPVGITFDHWGNIYFIDAWNERVRKIDTNGIITTIAGTGVSGYNGDNISADTAQLYQPWGVAVDAAGNIYISDAENHRIRKVDTAGIITTIAGTGIAGYTGDYGLADTAEINSPYGIIIDDTGNVYFVDAHANVIRKINTLSVITTFAGTGVLGHGGDGGPAILAEFGDPGGLSIDNNNNIYIADIGNARIRKITSSSGIITTVAGSGMGGFAGDNGPATSAELDFPTGVAVSPSGTFYIADFSNGRIRRVGWPLIVNQVSCSSETLIVYPNPSQGLFTIIIKSNTLQQAQLTVTNTLGEQVEKITINTNTHSTIQLNQPSGIYFLSVITAGGTMNKIINVIK